MNKLLIALNILFLTPSFAVGVNFDNVKSPDVLNAPVQIELESGFVYSAIRNKLNHLGSGDSDELPLNDYFGTYSTLAGQLSLSGYKKPRAITIIGFNADIDSIDRLTIKINYNMYHQLDIWNNRPERFEKTFVIKAKDYYQSFYNGWLNDHISNYETLGGYDAFNPKYIGKVSDLVLLQNTYNLAINKSVGGLAPDKFSDYKNFIFNGSIFADKIFPSGSYIPFSQSKLNEKDFYVIMPVGFDVNRVWISVAGDRGNERIDDGLDDDGEPYVDIDNNKYITFDAKKVEYLFFNEFTKFKEIKFEPDGNYNNPRLEFGSYNFTTKTFKNSAKIYFIDQLVFNEYTLRNIALLPNEIIMLYGDFGNGILTITYESDGLCVIANIYQDGEPFPFDETPIDHDDIPKTWLEKIKDLLKSVKAVFKIIALVFLLALVGFLISLLVKAIKNVKGDKNEK